MIKNIFIINYTTISHNTSINLKYKDNNVSFTKISYDFNSNLKKINKIRSVLIQTF